MTGIKVVPYFKYNDAIDGSVYFSPSGEYKFGRELMNLLPEEMRDTDPYGNWRKDGDEKAREAAYTKLYTDNLDRIKSEALKQLKGKFVRNPAYLDIYGEYPYDIRRYIYKMDIDPSSTKEEPLERPSLYDRLSKDLPDLDIVNEGGINWNWYSIPNAEQASRLRDIAGEYYDVRRMYNDPTHFRLHKYDEDSQLDDVLSKLAEVTKKRHLTKNVGNIASAITQNDLGRSFEVTETKEDTDGDGDVDKVEIEKKKE